MTKLVSTHAWLYVVGKMQLLCPNSAEIDDKAADYFKSKARYDHCFQLMKL